MGEKTTGKARTSCSIKSVFAPLMALFWWRKRHIFMLALARLR